MIRLRLVTQIEIAVVIVVLLVPKADMLAMTYRPLLLLKAALHQLPQIFTLHPIFDGSALAM